MVRIRFPGGRGAGESRGGRMSEQALDLRRSLQIVWRHKIIVGIFAAAGPRRGRRVHRAQPADAHEPGAGGAADLGTRYIGTQVCDREQRPRAGKRGAVGWTRLCRFETLRGRVQVKSLTPTSSRSAPRARPPPRQRDIANAVANSYVAYVSSANSPGVQTLATVLEPATTATGTSLRRRLLVNWRARRAAWPADRGHRRACDRPQGPAPAGARRDSGFHRGSGPGVDLRRSPIRRRGLDEAS